MTGGAHNRAHPQHLQFDRENHPSIAWVILCYMVEPKSNRRLHLNRVVSLRRASRSGMSTPDLQTYALGRTSGGENGYAACASRAIVLVSDVHRMRMLAASRGTSRGRLSEVMEVHCPERRAFRREPSFRAYCLSPAGRASRDAGLSPGRNLISRRTPATRVTGVW